MDHKGWIMVHRKIQDCWIWEGEEPFDMRSAWIDLLMMVNHEDKKLFFNGEVEVIRKGQRITSVRTLAERWHWSKNRVLKFLRLLESDRMIKRDSDNHRTLLTIVNYDTYQLRPDTNGTQTGHEEDAEGTQPGHDRDTGMPQTTMINNDNNDNNIYVTPKPKRRFVRPTLEEVQAYCQQRGNNVDAERFCVFYEMKGWKVGREIMKDWKAAVRTWEKNDNDRRGSSGGSRGNSGSRGPGGYDWDNL